MIKIFDNHIRLQEEGLYVSSHIYVNKHDNLMHFNTNNIDPKARRPIQYTYRIKEISFGVPKNEIWYETKLNTLIPIEEFNLGTMTLVKHYYSCNLCRMVFEDVVTEIPDNFINANEDIVGVFLPNMVLTIGEDALYGNPNLVKGFIYPNSITAMSSGCLSAIGAKVIDLSYTSIQDIPSELCMDTSIKYLKLPSSAASIGNDFIKDNKCSCVVDLSLIATATTFTLSSFSGYLVVSDSTYEAWCILNPSLVSYFIRLTDAINQHII